MLDNFTTGDHGHLHGTSAEIVEGDIRNEAEVAGALDGVDSVIHLAAAGSVVKSIEDPVSNFENNVLGTFSVLNAARKADVQRIVQASTGGALIGDAVPPVNELSLPKPISPYGASKLAGEGYAHAFAKSYGLGTVALRFGNVYGPWSSHKKGAVNAFFQAIHDGTPMIIYGDGSASRDYVHVDDISNGLQLALESDVPGGSVMHIASGVETSVGTLAALCREVAGAPDHPIEHRPGRTGEVGRNAATYALATELIGYRPTVDIADGLRGTWEWLQTEVYA